MNDEAESVIKNLTAHRGDIYVNVFQGEKIEVKMLKEAVDDDEELSQQEKEKLKKRIDGLEEEVEKRNESAVLKALDLAKRAGNLFWPMIQYAEQLVD